jgi:hypothetical protein
MVAMSLTTTRQPPATVDQGLGIVLTQGEFGQESGRFAQIDVEPSVAVGMSEAPGKPVVYNTARKELSEQLHRLSPVIALLYDRTLATLAEQPLTVDRLLIACHCIREMVNNLPEAFGDVEDLPSWSDMRAPEAELVRAWNKHMGPASEYVAPPSPSDGSASSPPLASVNVDLVIAANGVVQASDAATGNAHKRHSAVVLGRSEPGSDATVAIYQQAVGYFTGRAHLNKIDPNKLPSTDKLLGQLEVIEAALRSRLSNFFDIASELASLQAAANRKRVPSSKDST